MTTTLLDLAPVFRRAAEVIKANGHNKGGFYRTPDRSSGLLDVDRWPVDAVGALRVAATGAPGTDNELTDAAVLFLSPRIESFTVDSDPIERIADWNDRAGVTAWQVIAALYDAAKAAEAVKAS